MKSRKQQLASRASYYGDRTQGTPAHLAGSRGFEEGYKAAMRDLRKQVRLEQSNAITAARNAGRPVNSVNMHTAGYRATFYFLKPLR